VGARRCIDKLTCHANAIAGAADAAFQYIAHAEFAACEARVDRFTLKSETGIAGNDNEPAQFRQVSQDVFGDAVTEIFLGAALAFDNTTAMC